MRKIFILLITACFALNAQTEIKKGEDGEEPRFYIFSKFPVNVVHLYDFTEETKVSRKYSDSSTVDYTRYLNYDISLHAPSPPDEEEFQNILVSVDSLIYRFKDSDDSVSYNSQDDEAVPPFNILDYEQSGVPLGKEYELRYNPYYEVVDVTGEQLEFDINYIKDPEKGMNDTLRRFVWLNRLSDKHLSFMADIRKGLFPDFKAPEDTSWKADIYLELDGIPLGDSVRVHFKEYTVRNYLLEGESIGIIPIKASAVVHNIKSKSEVLDAKGDIKYEMKVSPRGVVNLLKIDADVTFKMKIEKEVFHQRVQSVYTWELGKMYKW